MSNESADGTVVRDPTDPAIVDPFGNTYLITKHGEVMVRGQIDKNAPIVTQLVYSGRAVWGQDHDSRWHHRRRAADPWTSDGSSSPLWSERLTKIEKMLERLIDDQDALVSAIKIDQITISIIFDDLKKMLQQLLADAGAGMPSRIAFDLSNVTIASQPVPVEPGP